MILFTIIPRNSLQTFFIFISEVNEVVNTILFLLSDKASMISGVTLPVDGGYLAT